MYQHDPNTFGRRCPKRERRSSRHADGRCRYGYILWTQFLRHNPRNPNWFNRDRFVLSAGHGSMLLYSLLYLSGYDLPLEEIKHFRKWGSKTPGHPERGVTPGVEATTGPLGQGFANGVGMAIAEAWLAARYNRPGHKIVDQPIEHLIGLRAIPGLTVIRPADPNEAAEAWAFAVQHNGPTLLVFTRQTVAHLDRSGAKDPGVKRGAYVLADVAGGPPDVILIGTGSEVSLCVLAREKLKDFGVKARVVSMPGWSLFQAQEESYRESVLPRGIKKRVTVEAGSPIGWHRWAGDEGTVIGVERFGASAPGQEVLAHLGFTPDHVAAAALHLLGKDDEADVEYRSEGTLVIA